jgi:hypothetical protein
MGDDRLLGFEAAIAVFEFNQVGGIAVGEIGLNAIAAEENGEDLFRCGVGFQGSKGLFVGGEEFLADELAGGMGSCWNAEGKGERMGAIVCQNDVAHAFCAGGGFLVQSAVLNVPATKAVEDVGLQVIDGDELLLIEVGFAAESF